MLLVNNPPTTSPTTETSPDVVTDLHLNHEWRRFIAYAIERTYPLDKLSSQVATWVSGLLDDLYTADPPPTGGNVLKALLYDKRANDEKGGTSYTTWTKRTINTEVDAGGFVTLANDEFTPSEGVYAISIRAAQYQGGDGHIRLYNVTQDGEVLVGDNVRASTGTQLWATLDTIITCDGSDAYRVDHEVTVSEATNGVGRPVNKGDDETYLVIELIPLSFT